MLPCNKTNYISEYVGYKAAERCPAPRTILIPMDRGPGDKGHKRRQRLHGAAFFIMLPVCFVPPYGRLRSEMAPCKPDIALQGLCTSEYATTRRLGETEYPTWGRKKPSI